jgi:perosamine synthetase
MSMPSPAPSRQFAEAVLAEGIGLNVHYQYVVADWPWAKPYLADNFDNPNARSIRDQSFCLYLNENYGLSEASDCANAIVKIERHFARGSGEESSKSRLK